MEKATLYPDLEWIEKKASYKQVFELFYKLAQCRYATHKQLQPLNHRVATKPNLVKFTELGYLSDSNLVKAYSITDKTRKILELEGFNTKVLQKNFTGLSLDHALLVTDYLLKIQDAFIFYSQFREPPKYDRDWLKPDACIVWKKDGAYKIQFLEVEQQKPDWENYLLGKREKYERLAQDPNLYFMWWQNWSAKLGLPMCDIKDFCFSIICVSELKFDWSGWRWI